MPQHLTPVEIAIQNWALKLAKAALCAHLLEQGVRATQREISATAKIWVERDPQWTERATRKVLGKERR